METKNDEIKVVQPSQETDANKPISLEHAEDSFENLFNKKKESSNDTELMKNILQQKAVAPKIKPILGDAPTLQKSLEETKISNQKNKLRSAQIIFLFVFFAALGMAGYFYSELSPKFDLFGPNTTARLTDVNKNLRSSQTTINKYRYLAAQLDLNAFSFTSDKYLDKTAQMAASAAKAKELAPEVKELAEELSAILSRIKDNLEPTIVLETFRTKAESILTDEEIRREFESDLRQSLQQDRKNILSAKILSENNEQNLRIIDNALKLVGNSKMLNSIKSVSVDLLEKDLLDYAENKDPEKRKEIQKTMESVLASTKSDIAIIGSVKAGRTEWSWIIDKIEQVTTIVDPNLNAGLFEVTGKEIVYNGYELESSTNKIVLSGNTRTNDANNFTLISDLIDQLEGSQYFKNVEMRSFTKSGSAQLGYTANFKIDLQLEIEETSTKNTPLSLVKRKVAAKPVKRIP
jgi:hypothetical protein